MFYYLKGTVAELGQNSIILDISGVGFFLNTSLKTLSAVSIGQNAKLFVAESIGENNYDLYGFADLQEKRFFELLISVSGVGPKVAISLLSSMTPDTLILSILNDDTKALTTAPGVGKKLAQRIILELRDKIGTEASSFTNDKNISAPITTEKNGALADATAAHAVLGYSSAEVGPILKAGNWTGMSADAIIRAVLKNMI